MTLWATPLFIYPNAPLGILCQVANTSWVRNTPQVHPHGGTHGKSSSRSLSQRAQAIYRQLVDKSKIITLNPCFLLYKMATLTE